MADPKARVRTAMTTPDEKSDQSVDLRNSGALSGLAGSLFAVEVSVRDASPARASLIRCSERGRVDRAISI